MKILFLDIETAPNVGYVWDLWNQNIGLNQLAASSYTLCWAAKWYDERDIFFDSLEESPKKKMIAGIHKLLDEADVVVHFNGTRFDIPVLNKEFIENDFLPPSPYKQIDLYKTSKQFKFPSHKLAYIVEALGIGHKLKHQGQELWTGCMNNDPVCWKIMKKYNINDVKLLTILYEKFLPWIKGHTNHGFFSSGDGYSCRNCGSSRVQKRGLARTALGVFSRYHCQDCGTWSRDSVNLLKKERKEKLLRQIT